MRRRLFSLLAAALVVVTILPAEPLAFAAPAAEPTTVVVQHSGMCLDVRGGPQAVQDGARIEQWHCTGAANQSWTLQDAGSGRFRLVAQNSAKCVEPIAGGTANLTGLQQMTCGTSAGQLWTRQATPTAGVYRFVHVSSARCLDVPLSSTVEGELLVLFDCTGNPNQSWAISQTAYPSLPEPIVVKHSGKCLDVRGGPQAVQDGAVIEQWQCTTAANQNWTLRDAGNGQVQLVAQNSGKCIQPVDGGTANSTALEQRTCASTAIQLWTRQNTAGAGEYRFVHVPSNRCLDVQLAGLTDGVPAIIFDCTGNPNQTWTIGAPTQAPPTVEVRNGEYWALPARYPAKSPHGGLYQIWGQSINWSPTTDMHWVGAYWRDLNPTDGTYRWDRIETIHGNYTYSLDQLEDVGSTALIWTVLGGVDGNTGNFHAPQWLRDKCAAQGRPITVINRSPSSTQPWGLALWEPCPRAEVKKFITQMFSRYHDDPRVTGAYATTFNAGEFWMPADVYNDAANKGLTPEILRTYAKDVIDSWATALGTRKVIWTSGGTWNLPGDAGTTETDWVNNYALMTLGTQLREGNGESVSANRSQPLIGQNLETVQPAPIGAQPGQSHYYLTARTVQELGRNGMSFYGNEFEIADLAGVFDNYDYYRMTVLNMLRKGHNWAIFPHDLRTGANDAAHPEFAALRDYFRQSAGYPAGTSPDAWAVLQMYYDGCYNGTRFYHNYEKFLLQRDVAPGGRTTVAEPRTWAPDQYGFCKVGEGGSTQPAVTYFARRTDHATGNDYIYFDVDDRYAPATDRVFRIAVTYRDTGTARWSLQYTTTTGAAASTPAVTNTNSGALKTAIFSLSDVSFRGAQPNQMDFRLYNGGSDITVRSVRVIRGAP
ncbi:RICIN domain-containing protein [Actinophytocola sp.]|uniref:RICIN domain-containing protein n=1 Tax=Actinophytocola sp. TaxID=1872138 RepID=UPI002D805BCA|nr:RICIN domain-containing protein [Actinophytocola sp.]HET9143478.1 RICIN domain-containing protein [Actinophytocola sp.]